MASDFATTTKQILEAAMFYPENHPEAFAQLVKAHEADKREAVKAKNNAYWERNQLVAVLSRLYPAHLARHDEADKGWEDDWRNIVCVHTPVGQATWHLHDTDMPMFAHLEAGKDHWDGHTTEEKYQRLAALDTPPNGSDKPQDGSESAQTPITPLGDNAAGSRSDGWAGEHEDAPWGQEAE